MSYATPQDLIDLLGDREATMLSDRAGTGVPDVATLTRALDDASAEVDGYVGRRYQLPLISALDNQPVLPKLLVRLTIDVARYRQTGTEIMSTQDINDRYKHAERTLTNIAEGKLSLGQLVLASAGGAAPLAGSSSFRSGTKVFGDLSGAL